MANIDITTPGANEAAVRDALFDYTSSLQAYARKTSDDVTQNITTASLLAYDEAPLDPLSMWSAGSPGRLTIPAALNGAWIRVTGNVRVTDDTADTWHSVFLLAKSSAGATLAQAGNGKIGHDAGTDWSETRTLIHLASTGDYFEQYVSTQTDTSVTIQGDGNQTYLALEVIRMPTVS